MPNYEQAPEEKDKQLKGKNTNPPESLTLREFTERLSRGAEGKKEKSSMKEKMARAIAEALEGSRQVKITLKPEAMIGAHYLLQMDSSKIIQLNENDKRVLGDVIEYGRWRRGHQTFTLRLTNKFDEKLFTRQLEQELKEIESTNSH